MQKVEDKRWCVYHREQYGGGDIVHADVWGVVDRHGVDVLTSGWLLQVAGVGAVRVGGAGGTRNKMRDMFRARVLYGCGRMILA
jgi:hypothetical protein